MYRSPCSGPKPRPPAPPHANPPAPRAPVPARHPVCAAPPRPERRRTRAQRAGSHGYFLTQRERRLEREAGNGGGGLGGLPQQPWPEGARAEPGTGGGGGGSRAGKAGAVLLAVTCGRSWAHASAGGGAGGGGGYGAAPRLHELNTFKAHLSARRALARRFEAAHAENTAGEPKEYGGFGSIDQLLASAADAKRSAAEAAAERAALAGDEEEEAAPDADEAARAYLQAVSEHKRRALAERQVVVSKRLLLAAQESEVHLASHGTEEARATRGRDLDEALQLADERDGAAIAARERRVGRLCADRERLLRETYARVDAVRRRAAARVLRRRLLPACARAVPSPRRPPTGCASLAPSSDRARLTWP